MFTGTTRRALLNDVETSCVQEALLESTTDETALTEVIARNKEFPGVLVYVTMTGALLAKMFPVLDVLLTNAIDMAQCYIYKVVRIKPVPGAAALVGDVETAMKIPVLHGMPSLNSWFEPAPAGMPF